MGKIIRYPEDVLWFLEYKLNLFPKEGYGVWVSCKDIRKHLEINCILSTIKKILIQKEVKKKGNLFYVSEK